MAMRAALLLLAAPAPSHQGPPAPKGFTAAPGYCVGDSSTTSEHCLNPPQQSSHGPCVGEADCFAKASAACLADDTCSAFAYDAKAMYETFTVGLANVVANSDWCAPPPQQRCWSGPGPGRGRGRRLTHSIPFQ